MFQLTDSDKKARCLCGFPLHINELAIYPISVRQVIEVGETQYNSYIMLLLKPNILFENFLKDVKNIDSEDIEKITKLEILLLFCSLYPQFIDNIAKAFNFFTGKDIVFNQEGYFEIKDMDIKVDEEFYNQFVHIIELQTYMFKQEEEKVLSKKAKEILDQKKKSQEKIDRLKNKDNSPLTITDYISIVSAKSYEMDMQKCLDMTIYALFDYVERHALFDNYDIGVKQLLAGAKADQVNLKHWLSKL